MTEPVATSKDELAREGLTIGGRVADALEAYVDTLHRSARRDAVWTIFKRAVFTLAAIVFVGFNLAVYAPLMGAKADPYKPSVVIVEIVGQIGRETARADKIVPLIHRACRQPVTRGVILRINSPGGSPTEAERIAAAVASCRKAHPDRPIVSVIEGVGASAAYLIATSATEIVANRYAVVGSIGAIATSVDASDAARHFGVVERTYASGPLKAGNGLFTQNSSDQDAMMQALVDGIAAEFAQQVRESRGDRLKLDTPDLFSGRVWMAEEAARIGLIDRVDVLDGYLERTFPGLATHTYRPTKTLNEYLGVEGVARAFAASLVTELGQVRIE